MDPQPAQRNSRCPTENRISGSAGGNRRGVLRPPTTNPIPTSTGCSVVAETAGPTFYIRTPVQVPAGTVTASATPSKPLAA